MNYAEIKEYDIANGPGVRMTLFVSGCRHHCKNCFNEIAWDFNYGNVFDETVENALVEKIKNSVVRGLTLLGGEPLDPSNQPGVLKLLRKVKKQCPGKDIWCYTGYVWEKDVCGWIRAFLILSAIIILYASFFHEITANVVVMSIKRLSHIR